MARAVSNAPSASLPCISCVSERSQIDTLQLLEHVLEFVRDELGEVEHAEDLDSGREDARPRFSDRRARP